MTTKWETTCCNADCYKGKFKSRIGHVNILLKEFAMYLICGQCNRGEFQCLLCRRDRKRITISSHMERQIIDEAVDFQTIRHIYTFHIGYKQNNLSTHIAFMPDALHINPDPVLLCTRMTKYYTQLLFVKRVDDGKYVSSTVAEAVEHFSKNEQEFFDLNAGYKGADISNDIGIWVADFITGCNYVCMMCEMEYDDGLPSIDIVLLHVCGECTNETFRLDMVHKK